MSREEWLSFLEGAVILTLIASACLAFTSMVSCEIQSKKIACFEKTKLEACLK